MSRNNRGPRQPQGKPHKGRKRGPAPKRKPPIKLDPEAKAKMHKLMEDECRLVEVWGFGRVFWWLYRA
ncbi:MAG: hypothetical protein AAFX99_22920 [Myxococcota bacterium]